MRFGRVVGDTYQAHPPLFRSASFWERVAKCRFCPGSAISTIWQALVPPQMQNSQGRGALTRLKGESSLLELHAEESHDEG